MGKVTWVIVGAGAGILLGKFVFALPQSRVLVAKVQDKLDPIEVPEFDEALGDVAIYDPITVTTPKPATAAPITNKLSTTTPTATRTTTSTSSPLTTTTTRTRLSLR